MSTQTAINFIEKLQKGFEDYSVVKRAYPHPFKINAQSENYGLFLPKKDWRELPRPFKKDYTPHTIEDVCAAVTAANQVLDFTNAKMKFGWANGHRVRFRFGERIEVAPNDWVEPTFTLSAGYDGKSFKVIFGLFRIVCANGLVVPVKGMNYCMSRLRHDKNLHEKMPDLVEDIEKTAKGIEGMISFAKNLAAKTVSFDQVYREIYPEPETSRGKTICDNRRTDMRNAIAKEVFSMSDGQESFNDLTTAWLMFNAVQGYYQHVQGKKRDRTSEVAIDWANNRKEVKAALAILS